jgi:hypothetical protein
MAQVIWPWLNEKIEANGLMLHAHLIEDAQ